MSRKLDEFQRLEVACKKVNIQPVIDELWSPFWIPVLLVAFFALGAILDIMFTINRDIRRFVAKLLRPLRSGIRRVIHGKKFRSKRNKKK